ncbi:MAG: HDIG domain-containing protein [Muribaculaceae bacterium]|nr:HDIG domain-containing protein [Muribaculaceae bacterium]
MLDISGIFNLFYKDNPELLSTVATHSECVARKALECLRIKNIEADLEFVREAALLHDIGVVRCNAPAIFCYGDLPYICHGVEGSRMLSELGLERHALVCERHTGSGLTIDDIVRQNLPLPHRDMCPRSIEEKAICYADKFFSKSGVLTEEKPLDKVMRQMEKFGPDSLRRFLDLHLIFG